jgi:hypothetical protein
MGVGDVYHDRGMASMQVGLLKWEHQAGNPAASPVPMSMIPAPAERHQTLKFGPWIGSGYGMLRRAVLH